MYVQIVNVPVMDIKKCCLWFNQPVVHKMPLFRMYSHGITFNYSLLDFIYGIDTL